MRKKIIVKLLVLSLLVGDCVNGAEEVRLKRQVHIGFMERGLQKVRAAKLDVVLKCIIGVEN